MTSATETLAELQACLSTPTDELERRVRAVRASIRDRGGPLVLFGAGHLGREVLAALRRGGVEPGAFADDTPAKRGTRLDGLEILSPEAAVERFGAQLRFAVTIWRAGARYLDIRRRLEPTGAAVWSSFHLGWAYPELLLPRAFVEHPARVIDARDQLMNLAGRLADDASIRELVAHVRFRLTLDFEALPAADPAGYLPARVVAPLPADVNVVDCGAYDGDTIRELLAAHGERFGRLLAVEPDPHNRARLEAYVSTLGPAVRRRIEVVAAAVGAASEVRRFDDAGTPSAAIAERGRHSVRVVTLDELTASMPDPLFVKLDVEGAEPDAVRGATRTIRERDPRLAVCVYHEAAHLWQLPLELAALRSDYRLHLRTHGEDGADLVCYAVPPAAA